MPSFKKAVAVFILSPILVSLARAEEPPAPEKPWSNKLELSVVSANGNSKATTSSAKNLFTYKISKTTFELEGGGLGSNSNGSTTAEEYFGSEKISYAISEKNYLFEKFRWDKNRFAGIRNRYDSSLGIGREFIKTATDQLIGEVGGGYVHEERVVGEDNFFSSGRLYSKYQRTFTPTASVSQDAEYIHNFDDPDDFRLKTETSLLSALSTHLALKVSYVWKHVGRPPVGFSRNDTITTVGLIATY